MNFVKVGRLLINLDTIAYVESFDPCQHGVEQAARIIVRFAVATGNENTIQLFGLRLEHEQADELRDILESSVANARIGSTRPGESSEHEVMAIGR